MKRFAILVLALCMILTGCVVDPAYVAETVPTEAPVEEPTEEPAVEPTETPTADVPAEADDASKISFSLTTLQGEPLDDSYFAGQSLTMINYWATWCGPCVYEIPFLVTIAEEYADKGFAILGVLLWDEDIDGAKSFLDSQGVTYPVVNAEGRLAELGESFYGIPTTLFVDSEGNIVSEPVVGSRTHEEWTALIDELLAQVG